MLRTRRKDVTLLRDDTSYKRVTIKLNGKGIQLRDELDGSRIGTKQTIHRSRWRIPIVEN